MRKSTLFISAVLTTFMLAVLVGVVSAYKNNFLTPQTAQTAPTAMTTATDTPVTATPDTNLTPEQAAALATQVLGRTDLYSVETSTFNGASAYLVTFSSGALVYVSPQGMILSVTTAPAVVYNPPPAPANNNKKGKPRTGGDGGGDGNDD